MSIESVNPGPERYTTDEREHGIQTALKAVFHVRRLIAEQERRLEIERSEKIVDLGIIKHITGALTDLKGELEDNLAFLEEFDPDLYQEMKDTK